jgi:S-DNA-T family DNA segregation ATPase FtsK/SpoIIIE
MELLAAMIQAPKAIATGSGAGVLLMLGALLAWSSGNASDVLTPIETVVDLVRWVAFIGGVVWGLLAAPWIGLAAVWAVGQHRHTAPSGPLPVQVRGLGGPITPSVVVTALRDLGIAALRKSIENMGDVGAAIDREDGVIETAHVRQDHCVERETQSKSRNRQAQLPC